MPKNNGRLRREERRTGAEKRRKEYQKKSPMQQLEILDIRFGTDKGAKKERKKLLTKLNKFDNLERSLQANNGKKSKKKNRRTRNERKY
jgi:hypothetical protein|tara:strand:- start:4556 stop:4822 length:267 start_codon:yes stop_codon:yes gene_type:complete